MATTVAALEIYAGETVTITGTAQNSSAAAIDITGYTTTQLTWRLSRVGASTASVERTIGSGIVLTTPASGIFTVTVPAASTSVLAAGEYVQYMVVTDGSSNVDVIWSGLVAVSALPGSPS